jgi:hypothetical protein
MHKICLMKSNRNQIINYEKRGTDNYDGFHYLGHVT